MGQPTAGGRKEYAHNMACICILASKLLFDFAAVPLVGSGVEIVFVEDADNA